MMGMLWMAEDPVPISPTVLPVKSTPSCGHSPVWYEGPANESAPMKWGTFVDDKQPVANTTNRAVRTSPWSVVTRQLFDFSLKMAEVTRVEN